MSDAKSRIRRRRDDQVLFRDGPPGTRRRGAEPAEAAADEEHQRALQRLDSVGRLLDSCIRVPFTPLRFGLDGVVGLVPIVGDAATGALALYPIVEARRLGFRAPTILRMLGNVAVDVALGAIPIVGDLFDLGFKANQRNVDLLRRRLRDGRGNAGKPDRADPSKATR